jgi:hypothetical protein
MLELDLCDADWDSRLAVYAGTSCPPSPDSLLACDDDGCGLQSRLELPVTAGHELLLRVGGYQEERGEGVLGLSFEPDCLPGGIPAPVVTLALVDSILCLGWQALEVPLEGCDPDSIGYCVWKRRQDQPWELVECTTGLVYQEDLSGVGEGGVPLPGDGPAALRVSPRAGPAAPIPRPGGSAPAGWPRTRCTCGTGPARPPARPARRPEPGPAREPGGRCVPAGPH